MNKTIDNIIILSATTVIISVVSDYFINKFIINKKTFKPSSFQIILETSIIYGSLLYCSYNINKIN